MTKLKQAQQEAWHRGNLSWKLHATQKLIEAKMQAAPGQLFVGNCSRQMGKSFWAVIGCIELAIKKPKAQIRYGAAFQSDLVDFIIPAFEKAMEDAPVKVKGVYKTQGSKFKFPNGSEIKLVGLDKNPNGLRGNTLDRIVLDECGFVSNLDYIYKSVIIPATTHRPDAKIILISTPPSTPAHAFMDYALRAESEGAYAIFDIYQNPLIDEDTIQRLMKESGGEQSTTWRREYLCEFVTDTDSAIIPEWKDEYVQDIERDEYYQYYHKYVGMDLGVKDLTACIFGYYDFKKATFIVEDEFHTSGTSMNTDLLVSLIKTKEKEIWDEAVPFRRVADNNWPMIIQDFSYLHNLTFIATNKDTLEAMINEVRILVQQGRIIVNPKCLQLIGCLKYGVWDSKKKGFARSSVYGHFDHLAALIYLIRNLAQHSNPIPVTHGHENHSSWLGNVKGHQHSNNAKTLLNSMIPKKPKDNF